MSKPFFSPSGERPIGPKPSHFEIDSDISVPVRKRGIEGLGSAPKVPPRPAPKKAIPPSDDSELHIQYTAPSIRAGLKVQDAMDHLQEKAPHLFPRPVPRREPSDAFQPKRNPFSMNVDDAYALGGTKLRSWPGQGRRDVDVFGDDVGRYENAWDDEDTVEDADIIEAQRSAIRSYPRNPDLKTEGREISSGRGGVRLSAEAASRPSVLYPVEESGAKSIPGTGRLAAFFAAQARIRKERDTASAISEVVISPVRGTAPVSKELSGMGPSVLHPDDEPANPFLLTRRKKPRPHEMGDEAGAM